jgi:transposase InsO family protein
MVSVTQKARWCQAFLTRIKKAREKGDKHAVARISGYYRVSVKSSYDWLKKWDGTWKSLVAKSHRPRSHPKAHTAVEIALMVDVRRKKGFLPPLLMFQELVERGYTRSYGGMKRFVRRHFATPAAPRVSADKPKAYDGGKFPGERMQLDVKFVPKACLYGEKLYQFTAVDEYSRWCFREIYVEHNEHSAKDFLKKLIAAAPFKILEVQTDNGHEWTNALFGQKVPSQTRFEQELVRQNIKYRRIRAGTPKHNGRVERQHGLDMNRFYKRQKFTSLDGTRQKVAVYNDWSNTRIKTCLNFRSPLQVVGLEI